MKRGSLCPAAAAEFLNMGLVLNRKPICDQKVRSADDHACVNVSTQFSALGILTNTSSPAATAS